MNRSVSFNEISDIVTIPARSAILTTLEEIILTEDPISKVPLELACYVKNIIEKNNYNINARDQCGKSPLNYALEAQCEELILILINNGAEYNKELIFFTTKQTEKRSYILLNAIVNHNPNKLFEIALTSQDKNTINFLFTRYPLLKEQIITGPIGTKSLQKAIKENDQEFGSFLIQHGTTMLSLAQPNTQGETLAHLAAFYGQTNIMKTFIDTLRTSNIDINSITDDNGSGLLHYTWDPTNNTAINTLNAITMTTILTDAGALNHPNKNDETPLFFARCHYPDARTKTSQTVINAIRPLLTPVNQDNTPSTVAAERATVYTSYSPTVCPSPLPNQDKPLPQVQSLVDITKATSRALEEELIETFNATS